MKRQKLSVAHFAPLLIILGASCWGIIGLFTKRLSSCGCSAAQIAFLRCAVSALLMLLYLVVFDRKQLKIALRDIWMFLGTGILSLVMFSVLYFTTIETTGLSVAAVLLYTAPCFVMIMSAIFFKEKITSRKLAALIVAFIGCTCTTGLMSALFSGSLSGIGCKGILTGLGSGFGYALYTIFGNVALKKYSSVTVTFYTLAFAAIGLAPFCLRGEFLALVSQPEVIWSGLGICVFSTIAPYLLYTLGLNYTQPGRASVLAFTETVVATLVGVLVFNETLTSYGVAGNVLIFASLLFLSMKKESPQDA